MDARDRILESLSGNIQDVPPVAIFTQSSTVGMMDMCGVSWPDAHLDASKMAELGSAQARLFGFESVRVPFDITAEAERLGCKVGFGSKEMPPCITKRVISVDPLDGGLPSTDGIMSPSEFVSGGRPEVILDSISLCSKMMGDHPICGGLLGPTTLLSQLMGAEDMILSTLLEPEWVNEWCAALSRIISEYAHCQSEIGADVITIVEAMASPDILDPRSYWELSGRHIAEIGTGSKTVLHICGSTDAILDMIPNTNADAFCPDPCMDPNMIVDSLGDTIVAVGSVDPVGTLLFSSPEQVVRDAHTYRDSGFHIICPGCGLAPLTSNDNLRALSGAMIQK